MEADRLREILDLLEASLDEPQLAGAELAGRAYLSRFHFEFVGGTGEDASHITRADS
jgi:hypothetical protein